MNKNIIEKIANNREIIEKLNEKKKKDTEIKELIIKIIINKTPEELKKLNLLNLIKEELKNQEDIKRKINSKKIQEEIIKIIKEIKDEINKNLIEISKQKKDLEKIELQKEREQIEKDPTINKKLLTAIVGIGITMKLKKDDENSKKLNEIFLNKDELSKNPTINKIFKKLIEPDKNNKNFFEKALEKKQILKDNTKESFYTNIAKKMINFDFGNPKINSKNFLLKVFDEYKNFSSKNIEKNLKEKLIQDKFFFSIKNGNVIKNKNFNFTNMNISKNSIENISKNFKPILKFLEKSEKNIYRKRNISKKGINTDIEMNDLTNKKYL